MVWPPPGCTSSWPPPDLDALDAALGALRASGLASPRGSRFRGGHRTRRPGPHRRLRDAACSVRLARPAMLAWDEDGDEDAGADGMLSTADTYTSEDAALVFEWTLGRRRRPGTWF